MVGTKAQRSKLAGRNLLDVVGASILANVCIGGIDLCKVVIELLYLIRMISGKGLHLLDSLIGERTLTVPS